MGGGGIERPLHPELRVVRLVKRLLLGAGCFAILLTLPSIGNCEDGGGGNNAYEEGGPEETDPTDQESTWDPDQDQDQYQDQDQDHDIEEDGDAEWDLDQKTGEAGTGNDQGGPVDQEWPEEEPLDEDEPIDEPLPETGDEDEEDADAEWDLDDNDDNGDTGDNGETGTGNDQGGPEDEPVDEPVMDIGEEDAGQDADAEWDPGQGQDPESPDNKDKLDNGDSEDATESREPGDEGDKGDDGDEDTEAAVAIEPAPVEKTEEKVAPYLIKPLLDITTGRNDSNPVWSPTGDMIAFERSIEGKKEIHVTSSDGAPVARIYYRQSDGAEEFDFFLPGIIEEVSYNAGVSWSPEGGRFVFMSNGGTGNYDIYLRTLGDGSTKRLTRDEAKEGQGRWSPVADLLVFVSGRTGKAELHLMDLVSGEAVQLTDGEKSYLYPRWSPDGKKIAMIYGSNENHDIRVIDDISRPAETTKDLTDWAYDDLSPVWSPDGKKIAFYTNYNADDDPKVWSIAVVDSTAPGPISAPELAGKVVAENVVPDIETGPAWLQDGKGLIYVKNDEKSYNPIYIVNLEDGALRRVTTGTRMNHDVTSSSAGTVAYRAQSEQWDHIYLLRLSR